MQNITKFVFVIFFLCMLFSSLAFTIGRLTNQTTLISSIKIENESYYTPYPAEPGQYVDLWIRVSRGMGESGAKDVVCKINPKFPFSLSSGEPAERNIGALDAGQLVLLKYRLKVDPNAVEGNNEIDFSCQARDKEDWSSTTFKIYVQTHDAILMISQIKSNPSSLLPGENGTITISLKNFADSSIKDISVSLNLSNLTLPIAPFNDVNERRVKTLDKDGELELQFAIQTSPSASVDVYKIPIIVSYSDNLGMDYSKMYYTAIAIQPKPKLFFALESTALFKNGTKGRVTASIANKGLSEIKFITVKVLDGNSYSILSSNEKYVGNLDPDESSSADFDLFAHTSNKQVDILFEINYVDAFGKEHTENKTLIIPLYSSEDAVSMGLEKPKEMNGWLLASGVIILLFLIWQGIKLLRKK